MSKSVDKFANQILTLLNHTVEKVCRRTCAKVKSQTIVWHDIKKEGNPQDFKIHPITLDNGKVIYGRRDGDDDSSWWEDTEGYLIHTIIVAWADSIKPYKKEVDNV